MRVLVTRPADDARRTALQLAADGHQAVVEPLLTIEPVAFSAPSGPFAAVTITSANAARVAATDARLAEFRALPLYAVGARSAAAARVAGFRDVSEAEGEAGSLAALLRARVPDTRVLYLAGEQRARDVAALVAPAGIEVVTLVVYRAVLAARMSAATAALLRQGEIGAVLHYSARSAAAFAVLAERAGLDIGAGALRHLCLSAAVAKPLIERGGRTEIAARPDESALLALLAR